MMNHHTSFYTEYIFKRCFLFPLALSSLVWRERRRNLRRGFQDLVTILLILIFLLILIINILHIIIKIILFIPINLNFQEKRERIKLEIWIVSTPSQLDMSSLHWHRFGFAWNIGLFLFWLFFSWLFLNVRFPFVQFFVFCFDCFNSFSSLSF